MATSGIVVSHGHARELESSLPALAPQVDELLVVANIPGSLPADLHGARVIENERPRSYSANLNAAFARTSGELVVVCNPDAVAEPEAVQALAAFADAHPRCGVAGPQMLDPDGTWQPSRRRFPTVMGNPRPPNAAPPRVPAARASARSLPARRTAGRAGRDGLDARRLPPPAADDAGRNRRIRLRFSHVRRGHRPVLPRRTGGVGALVRARRGRPPPLGPAHRPPHVDAPDALALAGHAALRPQAPRAAQGPVALYM